MDDRRKSYFQRFQSMHRESPAHSKSLKTLKVLEDNRVEDKISSFVCNPRHASEVEAIFQQTIGLDDMASSRQVQRMCTRSRPSKFEFAIESKAQVEWKSQCVKLARMGRDVQRRREESVTSVANALNKDTVREPQRWGAKSLPYQFARIGGQRRMQEIDRCIYRYAGYTGKPH